MYNFNDLFNLYYRSLCMYAIHLVDDDSVEDIVMECYIKLWNRLNNGEHIDDVKNYLFIAVRNACYDLNRKNCSSNDFIQIEQVKDVIPLNCDDDRSYREARLWKAIDSLPKKCREIFLMSKRDELTYVEIANELNLSVKTVEAQIGKAYKILRGKAMEIYFLSLSLFL